MVSDSYETYVSIVNLLQYPSDFVPKLTAFNMSIYVYKCVMIYQNRSPHVSKAFPFKSYPPAPSNTITTYTYLSDSSSQIKWTTYTINLKYYPKAG